jgi:glycosyltransferase involved in cell wall biosynthesis
MAAGHLRLLVIAYHFPPQNSAGAQRPMQMRKLLPRFGVDVTVVTHSYDRTALAAEPGVVRVFDSNSTGFGKLLHYPLRIGQRLSRALGGSNSWHGVWARGVMRRSEAIMRLARPDVVLGTYPPIETLDLALHFSEKYGVPLVADFRDGLLFEPVEPTMLRSVSTRARYRDIEHRIGRQAAGVITVSDPISDYFRLEYGHQATLTIPNGFDPDEPWIAPEAGELDRSKVNLVYTGRLGLSEQGREASGFIGAVQRLIVERPELAASLRVHFVGELSPSEVASLASLQARGIVCIHGLVPRAKSLGFQRAATMLLFFAPAGKASVATSKLFEYLNAGRPIFGVTRGTAAEKIIRETRTGVLVDPGDGDAIHEVLRRCVLEPGFLSQLSGRADEIATYSRVQQMKQLATFLKSLALAPARSA